MIKIIGVGKGSWKPVFICDLCGKQITEEGNVEFEADQVGGLPTTGEAFHLHKECDHIFTHTHPINGWWAWEDLSVFLRLLAQNTNLKPEKAKTWNELLGIRAEEK